MDKLKRLGIVITVLYTFITLTLGVYSYYQASKFVSGPMETSLFVDYKKTTDQQKLKQNEERKQKYIKCMSSTLIESKGICGAIFVFEPNYIKTPNFVGVVLFLLVIPAIFWVTLISSIFLFKWIKNGTNINNNLIKSEVSCSHRNHYLGMLVFGWIFSSVIFNLNINSSLNIYSVLESLGAGTAYLLLGWIFTVWKGPRVGWMVVFIFAFLAYMGSKS